MRSHFFEATPFYDRLRLRNSHHACVLNKRQNTRPKEQGGHYARYKTICSKLLQHASTTGGNEASTKRHVESFAAGSFQSDELKTTGIGCYAGRGRLNEAYLNRGFVMDFARGGR